MELLTGYSSTDSDERDGDVNDDANSLSSMHNEAVSITLHKTLNTNNALVHVYIPLSKRDVRALIQTLMGITRLQMVGKSVKAAFCEQDMLHVSLSRPVMIAEEHVPSLVRYLKQRLTTACSGCIVLCETIIALHSQNRSRLFVASPVQKRSAENVVLPLIRRVDDVYAQWQLPAYYDTPLPHMSFASTATLAVAEYFPSVHSYCEPNKATHIVHFEHVVCEIANRQYVFSLQRKPN